VLELFLPWYSIALAAFLGGVLVKSKVNFLAGFLAIALLWVIKAMLSETGAPNDMVIRVANIFTLPNKELLYVVMAVVGGLVGGFGCLSGALFKSVILSR
jgi:hypothetical protein